MLEVQLSGAFRDALGGVASVNIEAATIRELLRKLTEQHPRLHDSIEAGVAVSINGNIFRDNWGEKIPPDAEVFLLPRIPGG